MVGSSSPFARKLWFCKGKWRVPRGLKLYNMMQTFQKYNVLTTFCETLESGKYMSKSEWKRFIKNKVWKNEHHRWKVISMLYSNLRLLRTGILHRKMKNQAAAKVKIMCIRVRSRGEKRGTWGVLT